MLDGFAIGRKLSNLFYYLYKNYQNVQQKTKQVINYLDIPEIVVSFKDNVKTSDRIKMSSIAISVKVFRKYFNEFIQYQEELWAAYLNNRFNLIGVQQVSIGGLDTHLLDIRIVLHTALKCCSSAVIICHNHPSGDLVASNEDIEMSKKLQNGCNAIGITLLDHIILTSDDFISLKKLKLF